MRNSECGIRNAELNVAAGMEFVIRNAEFVIKCGGLRRTGGKCITDLTALPDPCLPTSTTALHASAHPATQAFQPGARTPMPSITRMPPQAPRRHSRNPKNGASPLRQLHPFCSPKLLRRARGFGGGHGAPALLALASPNALCELSPAEKAVKCDLPSLGKT